MESKPTYEELEIEVKKLRKELENDSTRKEFRLLKNILSLSSEIAIAATDINLNIIFFNTKAEEIFGYKSSEVIGKNLTEIHAMKNVELKQIEDAVEIVKKTGNYEHWFNIDTKYLKSNVRGIWNKEKELDGLVLFTTDITEQLVSQKEIRKLSTAVEQSANTIVITDPDGIIEYANPKFTELSGYELIEVVGKSTRILNAGIQSDDYYAKMWQTISAGKIWKGEFCNKTKDDILYWEHVTITPIKENKEIVNYLAIKEDITARKKAEAALNKSENRFKNIFENSPTGIITYDLKGNAINVNNQVVKILGSPSIEATKQINVLQFENLKKIGFSEAFLKCVKTKKTIKGENFYTTNWDQKKYIRYILTPISDNGIVTSILCIYEDSTERKEAEQKLKSAKEEAEESNQLKTEFFNNMSHEIRTPMNAILGFSQFIDNPDLSEVKRKQYVEIIKQSGNQLLRIIDDILEISSLETKQVKTIEKEICLNDLLRDKFSIFEIKAKENRISLYLHKGLMDGESTIITDALKLNKILENLLENALKFTTSGFIEFGYKIINAEIELYVKDTGIGIKPENQELIFKRFSQEEKSIEQKVDGLGLGLSIAKENAELLGGNLTLQSEKGKGSVFFVTIPYKRANTIIEPNLTDNVTETTHEKYTVLVVEDEEMNYLYLEILLGKSKLNLKIIHAKNGKEAVEICEENTNIGLVLMDMKMPIMSGFEATKLIKAFRPNLPIIAQTAYSIDIEKEKALSAGCDNFISKPIKKDNLYELLYKSLILKE